MRVVLSRSVVAGLCLALVGPGCGGNVADMTDGSSQDGTKEKDSGSGASDGGGESSFGESGGSDSGGDASSDAASDASLEAGPEAGLDAARHEGGRDAAKTDGGPSGKFPCGTRTCTAPAEFCYEFSGGPPPPPDSGPSSSDSCMKVPAGCKASPTCACIRAMTSTCVTTCTQVGEEITVQCLAP